MAGLLAGTAPPFEPKPGVTPGVAQTAAAPMAGPMKVQATAEEQSELERGVDAAAKLVYDNEKTRSALLDTMSTAEDPRSAVYDGSMMVIRKVDSELDLQEDVIPNFGVEVTNMVTEIGHESGLLSMAEPEMKQAMNMVMQGLNEEYGVDQEAVSGIAGNLGEAEIQQAIAALGTV